MKILILGCYYSANLGDGVICESVANQIAKAFPNAEIIIKDLWDRIAFKKRDNSVLEIAVSDRQLMYSRLRAGLYKFVTKYVRWDVQYISMRNRLRENQMQLDRICTTECDIVIFAGGQMFMDAYALRLWYVIQRFEAKGTPVILNACGAGEMCSKKLRNHLKEAMSASNVTAISCRDDVQRVNKYCRPQGGYVEETFDPALGCAEYYGVKKKADSKVVGLGIMWTGRIPPRKALHFWHELIKELEARTIPWKIFVNGESIDISFARHVIETLPGFDRTFEECIVKVPSEPEELVKTISQFKSIISFRLHSHIIATSLGVPSIAMVWDDKVRIFFEKIGCPERCCTLQHKPSELLDKLAVAESEGFDCEMIEGQKCYCEEWLVNAIKGTGKR